MTQGSSAPRIQFDTLGDDAIKLLSDQYKSLDTAAFCDLCIKTIKKGTGKNEKKVAIINAISNAGSKEIALKKTLNFILAGMGLAV